MADAAHLLGWRMQQSNAIQQREQVNADDGKCICLLVKEIECHLATVITGQQLVLATQLSHRISIIAVLSMQMTARVNLSPQRIHLSTPVSKNTP